jgi:hypothetical protein
MRRAALLSLCALTIAMPSTLRADELDGVEVIDNATLGDLRGGFAVGGVDIGFGAVITTYANGELALVTQLTWTDAGAVVQETLGNLGQTIDSLTPEQRAQLGIGDVTGGVVIADGSGVTALVHNVTEGALQNVILNTASGRDISQHVDVTLTLPGFEDVQKQLGTELFGMRINEDFAHMAATAPGG